ncbi:hypothetical protein G3M48_005354 [Beauveria asiatica]|uniref:SUR7 protein n=1 Tax=Beauveria asiatica TaxID=1069075 RepID=A0AAW0RRB0_9HYPO
MEVYVKNNYGHLAKQLLCVVVVVTTCVVLLSDTCRREGFFHWTHNGSDSRRGLGNLLQSAGSDVAKSLFTSAKIGTSHLCGGFSGHADMCVSYHLFITIAIAIIVFLLLSLALFIAVAVMARPPRPASRAAVFCQRIGLGLVLVGFAFATGAYGIGRQLHKALGGQLDIGLALVGFCVIAGLSIVSLAADTYNSYHARRPLAPQENKDPFADQ